MKLKLLLTMGCGIISFEAYGADLVEDGPPNSVTDGAIEIEEVVIQVDERAGSPATIVRNKGKGVRILESRDPNLSALKKESEIAGAPQPLNLGDGTPRTNSDFLSSANVSTAGGSKAGSPSATPKAAGAAANTEFSAK